MGPVYCPVEGIYFLIDIEAKRLRKAF